MRFLIFIILFFIYFLINSSVTYAYNIDNNWACGGIKGRFVDAENWPGGKVQLSCPGPLPGKLYCKGNKADIGLGESFDFNDCNCYTSNATGECFTVTGYPDGCQVLYSGDRCGANGVDIGLDFSITCPAPPIGDQSGPEQLGEGQLSQGQQNQSPESGGPDETSQQNQSQDSDSQGQTDQPLGKTTSPSTTNPPTPVRTSPSGKTSSPSPGKTSAPSRKTPSPKPTTPFSEAMCQCDGIQATPIFPGEKVDVTSFGKVEGKDTSFAKIKSIAFTVTKDNTIIQKSQPISASTLESSSSTVRYNAKWSFNFPLNVDTKSIYRIFSTLKCEKKSLVSSLLHFPYYSILGDETQQLKLGVLKPAQILNEKDTCRFLIFKFPD